MQKDKALDELLKQYAIEETNADFTAGVMNKITALQTKQNVTPLLQTSLAKILVGVFALVCISLLIVSMVTHPFASIKINILPSSYIIQLIYFFIAFWAVMLANQWLKKRNIFC